MSLVFSPVKLPDFFRLTAHSTSEGRSEAGGGGVEGHGETFSQAFPEKMDRIKNTQKLGKLRGGRCERRLHRWAQYFQVSSAVTRSVVFNNSIY